jgi:predicted Zn-dependent peptidase
VAGQVGPRRDVPEYYALELLNTVLGGAFNSRINLSLREAHGWTYGASSAFLYRVVPETGTFQVSADVSTPKTDSALVAIVHELTVIRSERPVNDSELTFAKRTATLSLPLQFVTVQQFAGATAWLLEQHLPLDYYDHLTGRFLAVTSADERTVARRDVDPTRMAIVVIGDRHAIEGRLRAAGVAPIVVVDEHGKPAL